LQGIKKLEIIQKLLEQRYPVHLYDKSAKNSIFRLRADRAIAYMNKIESEVYNRE